MATAKQADLAGPGIGADEEIERILPTDYRPLLGTKDTQLALHTLTRHFEDHLCREPNLIPVEVPLIVSRESGVNDYLDRDGSRTPIEFLCGPGLERPALRYDDDPRDEAGFIVVRVERNPPTGLPGRVVV